MKSTKNFIIGALLIVILAMAVGYSALATQINLKGTAEIVGEWDVRITNIEVQEITEGCDSGEPQYTNTSATFNAKLVKPGDKIIYVITIQNNGTIDALLDNIACKEEENGSEAIKYSTSPVAATLAAGEETKMTIKVEYDPEYTEIPTVKTKTITGIIEYVQER